MHIDECMGEETTCPPHYDTIIQPVEYMQAVFTPEEYVGYLKGNLIKYLSRMDKKGQRLSDVKKIAHYAQMLLTYEEVRLNND